jgi:hypothetical protein
MVRVSMEAIVTTLNEPGISFDSVGRGKEDAVTYRENIVSPPACAGRTCNQWLVKRQRGIPNAALSARSISINRRREPARFFRLRFRLAEIRVVGANPVRRNRSEHEKEHRKRKHGLP